MVNEEVGFVAKSELDLKDADASQTEREDEGIAVAIVVVWLFLEKWLVTDFVVGVQLENIGSVDEVFSKKFDRCHHFWNL